jgi:hypothetical protein
MRCMTEEISRFARNGKMNDRMAKSTVLALTGPQGNKRRAVSKLLHRRDGFALYSWAFSISQGKKIVHLCVALGILPLFAEQNACRPAFAQRCS